MEGSNRKTGMLLRVCTLLRKDMDGKKKQGNHGSEVQYPTLGPGGSRRAS